MKNSLKQLFRRPGRAALLFFLMAAASMLLALGAAMYVQNALRQEKLNDLFVTMGTVEQPGAQDGQDEAVISPKVLNFPGTDYVIPPEHRPVYLAELPDSNISNKPKMGNLMEFQVLEIDREAGNARVKITNLLLDGDAKSEELYYGHSNSAWDTSLDYTISLKGTGRDFQAGKTYIGYFYGGYGSSDIIPLDGNPAWEGFEGMVYIVSEGRAMPLSEVEAYASPLTAPFSTQRDSDGKWKESAEFSKSDVLVEEVTKGFWEKGGRGEAWLRLKEQEETVPFLVPVLGVTSDQLLPSFRESNVQVTSRGRAITEEEFRSGAKVCMVEKEFMRKNLWQIGDKVRLPLRCALYGCSGSIPNTGEDFSLLNAQGELYQPFWDEEYEIVGEYSLRYPQDDLSCVSIVISQNSIGASDESNIAYFGPMNSMMTSFQLPNGTIEEFDHALREAVPEAENLKIEYDDMGYSDVKENLESVKQTALLMLAAGILASAAAVALLIYFFVVREKKRTAVERSLGMTKRQCRTSLLSGLLALTVTAAILGSCCAGLLLEKAEDYQQMDSVSREVEMADGEIVYMPTEKMDLGGVYHFSARYSPWAMWDAKGNQAKLDVIDPPAAIYALSPLLLCLLTLLLAVIFVNRSLKIDPILLLSNKEE